MTAVRCRTKTMKNNDRKHPQTESNKWIQAPHMQDSVSGRRRDGKWKRDGTDRGWDWVEQDETEEQTWQELIRKVDNRNGLRWNTFLCWLISGKLLLSRDVKTNQTIYCEISNTTFIAVLLQLLLFIKTICEPTVQGNKDVKQWTKSTRYLLD